MNAPALDQPSVVSGPTGERISNASADSSALAISEGLSMRTYLEAKAMKALRAALAAKNISLSHSECLELVSKQLGFDEWNMLSAKIALETGECEPTTTSDDVSLQPPVPVLTIASAAEARKFYLDYLGFTADWGWPENGQGPLYAQISRSEVTLRFSENNPPGMVNDWETK
jgi:hypothetical protein